MKTTKPADEKNPTQNLVDDVLKIKPNLRQQYILEKERIQHEIGDLNQIRETLGLSQRKLCQLLLVDPSAWTRWSKTGAPPHIYQALRWLVQLKNANPEAVAPSDISSRVDFIQSSTQAKIKDLENNVAMLERALSAKVAMSTQTQATQQVQMALRAHEQQFQTELQQLEARIAQLLEQRAPKKKSFKKRTLKKSPRRAKKKRLAKTIAKTKVLKKKTQKKRSHKKIMKRAKKSK